MIIQRAPFYGIKNCHLFGWGDFRDVDEEQKMLLAPVRYMWEDQHGLQEHEAPKGYIFDGASKWRFGLWRIMGYPWGGSAKAGCLHDRCFTERFRLSTGDRVDLEYSAALYLCFLQATNVGWFQRNVEYQAVLSPFAEKIWHAHDAEFALNP